MKCIQTFSFDTFSPSKLLFICLWLKKNNLRLRVKLLFLVEASEGDDGVWKDA